MRRLREDEAPPGCVARSCVVIDLNTASGEELDAVPMLVGHGFEIVRYREERGRYTALRRLAEMPGLAGELMDGVDRYVRVDGGAAA